MGSTARHVRAIAALALALALAAAPARAQRADPSEEAAELESVALVRVRLAERITGLLGEVAYGARSIEDPALRLSCQMQAASLLWPREPDRAREVYAEAFDMLLPSASAGPDERARAGRLLSDLLAHTARHDPVLAERFARRLSLAPASDEAAAEAAGGRSDILAAAAIEMLPADPARAAALGRLALGEQITPNFMRLLVVLRGVDAARADALFATALGLLARSEYPRVGDVQMLAFYFGANGQGQFDGVPPDLLRAYLETAFRLVVMTSLDSKEASTAYFLGRQLAGAFARYLPDRTLELESRLALLATSAGLQQAATPAADRLKDTADARRARAATAAIERDDYRTVHAEAAAIEDDDLQTRVYAQASLHLIKQRRLDEAAREIARVPEPSRRASLLIQLALAAHARGDMAYAVETLSAAGREAGRSERAGPRLQALFSIASAYVNVDPLLAFEAMKAAIEGVNRALRAADARSEPAAIAPSSLNFDATLARLAHVDFDRALLLAQEFDSRGHRLLAVLAVCRGGLVSSGFTEIAEDLDDDAPLFSL